jgi:polyisoprenyl-teichoic acid--peptidoglycan teichoic acid transferase
MPNSFSQRTKSFLYAHRYILGILLAILVLLVALTMYYLPVVKAVFKSKENLGTSFINLTKDPQEILKNDNGRTNILLLGMGGAGHEAGTLTDSVTLISYKYQSRTPTIISIPRDLWVDSLKAKINTAYYYGEQKQKGGGILLAKSSVEELTGIPISYVMALDFGLFKKAIDLVGGVTIDVPSVIDDYEYPIAGRENALPIESRYEHLHFDAGIQTMDGERALKYVRSRHAQGSQGTDFARSERQRQILLAIRDQVIRSKILLDPVKINTFISENEKYFITDVNVTDYPAFLKIALDADTKNMKSIPLVTKTENPEFAILEVGDKKLFQGQYVLVAKDKNWAALKQFIQNELGK